MGAEGWTASDEQRLHAKLLRDAQDEFESALAATRYELRLASRGILLLTVAAAIFFVLIGYTVPGHEIAVRVGLGALLLLAAAGLACLVILARKWTAEALLTYRLRVDSERLRRAGGDPPDGSGGAT